MCARDLVIVRESAYIRTIAVTAMLVKETNKLTFKTGTFVITPYSFEVLLRWAPERWLSMVTQCQTLGLDEPCIQLSP